MKTSYLDLVLIHWPGVKGLKPDDEMNSQIRMNTYQVLEEFYFNRVVKLIGVSNYNLRHLKELLQYSKVKPHIIQVLKTLR